MSDFKRENRYIVIKRSDLEGAVSDLPIKYQKKVWDQLGQVVSMPNKHRQNTGKSPLECVIVEHDWPEYDYVWKAIKHRMETGECLFEQQQARIAKLEHKVEKYEATLFAAGAMGQSPCFKCGYNGPGYYQPGQHPCAAQHHAAIQLQEAE